MYFPRPATDLISSVGFVSLDLVLPVAPQSRTDTLAPRDIDAMRTNAASRWAREDHSEAPSRFRYSNNDATSSKVAALARPKLELMRGNSPTFKRLLAARVKLDKYANTLSRAVSASRQSTRSTRETSYPYVYDKPAQHHPQSSRNVPAPPAPVPVQPAPVPLRSLKSQATLANVPLDKITYEKTWTHNGNLKQKCSLEIWLPKANVEDEDDHNSSSTITPDSYRLEKRILVAPTIRSRRSSIVKIATTTVSNIEKSLSDDQLSKKSEPVRPRIYHYADYIMEPTDDRPRSSKSVTTVKSDGTGSLKSIRRQHTRSQTRRQSISTNHSEEILRFATMEVPASGKPAAGSMRTSNAHTDKRASSRPTNPSMITELMQKYSLMKKSHQELIQARLQLEKPHNDANMNASINRGSDGENAHIGNLSSLVGDTSSSRPPPVPEPTSLVSPEHPTVSVKKLLLDTSLNRSSTEHSLNNSKLLDRRGTTPRKPSYSDVFTQSRVFSLANQQQHRQPSASASTNAVLPTVVGKKSDQNFRLLQRSKTLDIVLDLPNESFNSGKSGSRYSNQSDGLSTNLVQHTANGNASFDHAPSRFSRRSLVTVRPQPQTPITGPIVQIVPNSGQRFHHFSTTRQIPTNKVLVQFNGSNH